MRCGKARCCGQLIAWAAPGTQVKCPECGKLVRTAPVREVPEIGKPVAAESELSRRWARHVEQKENSGNAGR